MFRRSSSRRRKPYTPKEMSIRYFSQEAISTTRDKPEWRQRYGERTTEDILLQNFRLWVLQQCDGCRTQAAEILGISTRSLHLYLNKYEEWGETVTPPPKDRYRTKLPRNFWQTVLDKITWGIRE